MFFTVGLTIALTVSALIAAIIKRAGLSFPLSGDAGADAATLASIVIAIFTVALFGLQWRQHQHDKRVQRANYKLAMHEQRLEQYQKVEELSTMWLIHGSPKLEEVARIRWELRHSEFLFPPGALTLVETIIDLSFEHGRCHVIWEPLREKAYAGHTLTNKEAADKKRNLDRMHEIESWIFEQITNGRLKEEFRPYLDLPSSI